MQIREQGRRIQLIRSEYDPTVKRSRQTVITTLPRYGGTTSIPQDVRELLSSEEANHVESWLARREQDAQARGLAASVTLGSASLHRIADGLAAGHGSAKEIAAIETAITTLRKELRARKRHDKRAAASS